MFKRKKESMALWVICIGLAVGGPIFILRDHIGSLFSPEFSLSSAGANLDPYCYDTKPAGDGIGFDFKNNFDCYLTTQAAQTAAGDPQNYCYDASPVGDSKGWNAAKNEVCFFGTDPAKGPKGDAFLTPPSSTPSARDLCVDVVPEGDGVGYNKPLGKDCYLSADAARNAGADPRDYCFDTDPAGDGKGWNAFESKVCYFKADDQVEVGTGEVVVGEVEARDPRDYCFDTEPVGDKKGWNAFHEEVCVVGQDTPGDNKPPTADNKPYGQSAEGYAYCGPSTKEAGTWDDLRNYGDGSIEGGCIVSGAAGSGESETKKDTTGKLVIPQGLRATNVSEKSVTVSWTGIAGAQGYNVERNGAYYKTITGATSFVDTDVQGLRAYVYKVSAFAGGNYSNNSDPLKVVAASGGSDTSRPPANKVSLPVALRDQYSIAFYDEFNGQYLDPNKWNTSFIWGPSLIINNEEQYYVDTNGRDSDLGYSPFTFKDGSLVITAQETPAAIAGRAENQKYTSGLITSYDAFKFTHGYAEARVKVPEGQGLWPAFWLLNAYYIEDEKQPEIDIMELLGNKPERAYQTYHHFLPGHKKVSSESHVDIPSGAYSDGYHIFSAEWKPGLIQFYIDSVPYHRIEGEGVANEEMYVLANLALGGWWPGAPDKTTPFPAEYSIDWIRVYQKN